MPLLTIKRHGASLCLPLSSPPTGVRGYAEGENGKTDQKIEDEKEADFHRLPFIMVVFLLWWGFGKDILKIVCRYTPPTGVRGYAEGENGKTDQKIEDEKEADFHRLPFIMVFFYYGGVLAKIF